MDDYKYLRNIVGDLSSNDPVLLSILSGIANGDRRTNSSFRRANISFKNGMECVEELCDMGIISSEKSLQHLTNQQGYKDVSKKLLFKAPFLRFWFAFVSPIFKGIRDGDYEEFFTDFENRKTEFVNLVFEQLSLEFIKKEFGDDGINQIGRYWDDELDIGIIAKTNSGQIIAGTTKYTNSKVKKSELTKLKEDCDYIGLKASYFIFY